MRELWARGRTAGPFTAWVARLPEKRRAEVEAMPPKQAVDAFEAAMAREDP